MKLRTISIGALALFFIASGINHFVNPHTYLAMMPDWLPRHEAMNVISGAAEIAGGLGVLIRRLRRLAGWGLMDLLIAVFPANIHTALHGWPGVNIPRWLLWLRLPVQPLLMIWVWWTAIRPDSRPVAMA